MKVHKVLTSLTTASAAITGLKRSLTSHHLKGSGGTLKISELKLQQSTYFDYPNIQKYYKHRREIGRVKSTEQKLGEMKEEKMDFIDSSLLYSPGSAFFCSSSYEGAWKHRLYLVCSVWPIFPVPSDAVRASLCLWTPDWEQPSKSFGVKTRRCIKESWYEKRCWCISNWIRLHPHPPLVIRGHIYGGDISPSKSTCFKFPYSGTWFLMRQIIKYKEYNLMGSYINKSLDLFHF